MKDSYINTTEEKNIILKYACFMMGGRACKLFESHYQWKYMAITGIKKKHERTLKF